MFFDIKQIIFLVSHYGPELTAYLLEVYKYGTNYSVNI